MTEPGDINLEFSTSLNNVDFKPRRPLDHNYPEEYLESDNDFIAINHDLVMKFLEFCELLEATGSTQTMVMVPSQSLLNVVRKLDFGAYMPNEVFSASFDDLRAAFTPDEIERGWYVDTQRSI